MFTIFSVAVLVFLYCTVLKKMSNTKTFNGANVYCEINVKK